jgi:hypothetical protein
MTVMERLLSFGKPGFRWLVYEHCDTGNRQLRHADPDQPNPEVAKGWVLIKSVVHNPSWTTASKVYDQTQLLH